MKAFVFDPLWNELVDVGLKRRLAQAGVEVTVVADVKPLAETTALFEGTEDRLLCLNPDYVGWKLKSSDYENIPGLKGILIESTGFEWVEREAANARGIPICHIVDFSTQAVAEWAVLMMSALARQIPRLIKDGFPLDYDKDFLKYRGVQLKGKTVGVIGLGHIGTAVAELCDGLGMKVVYWSKSSTNEKYDKLALEQLMATSDVVFPTVAKNPETLKLITDEHVASMKQSAILVDIAHGLVNEKLVLEMVKSGKLFGFGFEGKPSEFNSLEGNVWAAPAYAWATRESMYNSVSRLVDNMISAASGEFPHKIT